MLIRIDKQFTGEFERKISAFARKCLKFGIDFEWKKVEETTDFIVSYTNFIGEPRIVIIRADDTEELNQARNNRNASVYPLPVVVYEMTETTAKVNGDFAIAAKLDRVNGGNITETFINPATGERFEIPEKYHHSDGYCEHCRTQRERTKLYVIQNRKNGEFFQVGRTYRKIL